MTARRQIVRQSLHGVCGKMRRSPLGGWELRGLSKAEQDSAVAAEARGGFQAVDLVERLNPDTLSSAC